MQRPIAVPRGAMFALFFGLYLTVRGYHSRDGDQAYRLPLLIHQQDPSRFADDHFVRAFDRFNPHRGYIALLDLASRPFGLSFALFGLFAATYGLTCLGIDRLARAIWPDRWPDVGLVAVGFVLLAKAGNIGTNHLFEAMLLDRLIGFGLGWVALALAIDGERWRPSLAIGLATMIHPSVGLQLGGLLGASWLAWAIGRRWTRQSWRSTASGLAILTIAVLPGSLPTLMQGASLFDGLSAGDFRLLGVELQMAQHMVPSLWRRPQWLAWAAYIVLGIIGLARPGCVQDGSAPPVARTKLAILFGVLLAGLAAAYLAIEVVGSLKAAVFQPFRMATIARGLALIALSGRCRRLWDRGGLVNRGRVLLLAAGLAGDWAFVVAAAIELFATGLGVISLHSRVGSPSPERLSGTHRGTGLLVAVGLVWGCLFLSRHDTEQGQWWLIAASALAIATVAFSGRVRLDWTRRRLAFAVLASWAVPVAALILPMIQATDSRLVQMLVARCRFGAVPADDIERLAAWSRDHLPRDAHFITPPGPKTFRLWSERSVAFNRAASPYHAEGLKDWSDRFRAHVGFEGSTADFVHAYLADRHGLESRYGNLTPPELIQLARSQGADYILAAAPSGLQDDNDQSGGLMGATGSVLRPRAVRPGSLAGGRSTEPVAPGVLGTLRSGLGRPSGRGNSTGSLRLLKTEGRYAVYRLEETRLGANTGQ